MIPAARLVEVADALERDLCAHLGCTVVAKDDSALHRAIAAAFDGVDLGEAKLRELATFVHFDPPRLALPTGEEYLTEFTTTIGDTIAVPRAWRDPARVVERLITPIHEGVHVEQHQDGVNAGWWPKAVSHSVLYLASAATDDASEYLGKVEADAYAVGEYVARWLGLPPRATEDVIGSLTHSYAIRPAGAVTASLVLRSHYATMATGGLPNVRLARWARDWYTANAPDLAGALAP